MIVEITRHPKTEKYGRIRREYGGVRKVAQTVGDGKTRMNCIEGGGDGGKEFRRRKDALKKG